MKHITLQANMAVVTIELLKEWQGAIKELEARIKTMGCMVHHPIYISLCEKLPQLKEKYEGFRQEYIERIRLEEEYFN